MNMLLKNKFNLKRIMFFAVPIWFSYACFYLLLIKNDSSRIAGYFALIGQVGLDLAGAVLTGYLFCTNVRLKNSNTKIINLMFFISFVSAIFSDGIYNLITNILDIKYFSNINSLFEVPFLSFLLFQTIAWTKIFFKGEKTNPSKKKYYYIPYLMVSILIFIMFIFGINWKIQYHSLLGSYQFVDTILEVVGFTLAAICLARAKDITVRLVSTGYLVIISSDLLIRYNVVSGLIPFLNPFETTWILGLLLMVTGFLAQGSKFKLLPLDSLQSNLAISLLSSCLMFVILFALSIYLFSPKIVYDFNSVNKNLLSTLIPFSILAIICSKYISSKISSPLEKLENIIRKFSNDEFLKRGEQKTPSNSIHEFVAFENFVYDTFAMYQKKHLIEAEFSNMATQVAHDIRSPLAALTILTNHDLPIPEQSRTLLLNVINRIRDIANDLVEKNRNVRNFSASQLTHSTHLLASVIYPLITEKRLQFRSKSQIAIEFELNADNYGLFTKINLTEFKRMLSNLINNSIESMDGKGHVSIILSEKEEYIQLIVLDNGKGIPLHILEQLGHRRISHNKKNGSGLGLYHAKDTIAKLSGDLHINSKLNKGTEVILTFPKTLIPNWFLSKIKVYSDITLVIIDDDISIHQLWKERFKNFEFPINFVNFTSPNDFHDWQIHLPNKPMSILYLFDLEFHSHSQTGFELIEKYHLQKNSILVTSHFEENNVRACCEKLKIKMIPKDMAGFVPIEVTTILNKKEINLQD